MSNTENYERITSAIVKLIEEGGELPWQKPWRSGDWARSMSTKREYNGINRWNLTMLAQAKGWSPWFGTYKQIVALGGQVRKGEKSTIAIFWKFLDKIDPVTGQKGRVPLLRMFNIFSASQADGLPEKFYAKPEPSEVPVADADAEAVFAAYTAREGITVNVGGSAFYMPSSDSITLPALDKFFSAEHYAATAFHEAGHSTGAEKRLNRPGITDPIKYGSHQYSREELVAEFSSALVMGVLGVARPETEANTVAYLKGWCKALTDDPQALVWAAGRAEKAANLILGIEAEKVTETAEEA